VTIGVMVQKLKVEEEHSHAYDPHLFKEGKYAKNYSV